MSRKKLALIISLVVSIGAIAGGIVYAQEASTPQVFAWQTDDVDWQEPATGTSLSFLTAASIWASRPRISAKKT